MNNEILIATGLEKSYARREVLRGASLTVQRGEFLSVMGESGSGKSTLLGILGGNIRPESGSVLFDGRDVTRMTDRELASLRRRELGFVFQSLNLIGTLNARDNILLPLVFDGADLRAGEERMRDFAARMGVAELLNAFPEELSGGERQRVAITRAMVHEPILLMLDEPTGSLDSKSAADVMCLLRSLNRERGVTVLQVTHSELAASYGNRIVRMCDGLVSEL